MATAIDLVLVVSSGLFLISAFPKFDLYLLAYAALVPLLISIRRARSLADAATCGFIGGFIFFGGALYWINILSKWAGLWVNLAWVVLAVFQALFMVLFAVALKWSYARCPKYSLVSAPLIWVTIEWIRSLGPYGVTGGGLGYCQADLLPILQVASIFSVYGISFLVVFINEAIAKAIVERRSRYVCMAALIFVLAYGFGHYRISGDKDPGRPLRVAVIQADIAQDVKLDFGLAYQIVEAHESLSRKALTDKPEVIIWPETAVTTYLFESNRILPQIKKLVRESRSFYLIGTPYREDGRIYNSVVAFSRSGELLGRYDKQRLVPFGEYLPLRPLFYRLFQENPLFAEDYNSNPKPRIIDLGIVRIGVVVCFESTFPYIVRDRVKRGAQFILVTTNDAWFYDTAALYQHLQAARMRAVENKMYVVQAANTGISAIIDPLGRVLKRTSYDEETVLSGTVYVH